MKLFIETFILATLLDAKCLLIETIEVKIGPESGTLMSGKERSERLKDGISEMGLDGLVCALPKNVLMLSGYWPVVGTSVAIALSDGTVRLIVPEDEKELARTGWAKHIETFKPGSLDSLTTASEAVIEPLRQLEAQFASGARIGIEHGENSEPSSYAAMHLYGGSLSQALKRALPKTTPVIADGMLGNLRAIKTEAELGRLRTACALTKVAFGEAAKHVLTGLTELAVAERYRAQFKANQAGFSGVQRAEAFFFAMSGVNSAKAHAAYARSRPKQVQHGDLLLVHCNTCADGYWTDITRTYSVGRPDDRRNKMYAAIFAAREAAFKAIAPGRKAAGVDHAARKVLEDSGFGKEFKHSTGHGVGFGAISPNALPRIHPKSPDILEPGMVFNVEPGVYIDGFGGIRHCDMVAVTDSGYELLTDFQSAVEDLFLSVTSSKAAC